MAKLGVITDGISRDLRHALGVMREVGLTHAELQFIGEKEVGDLSSPLKKASLTGFHATAKHIAAKAVSPSSETMRTI